MKKFRILIIYAVLVAVLIPGTVSAAGVFYCSTTDATGGDGSYDDPWACTDAAELDIVINDQICDIYNGGSLYQVYPDSYRYHVIRSHPRLITPVFHLIRESKYQLPISLPELSCLELDYWLQVYFCAGRKP